MSYDFDQQPQGMSSGAKTAIGCGLAAFLCMALICGGIVWVGYLALEKAEVVVNRVIDEMQKQVDSFAAPFEAQGFERVTGQVVEITSDIQKPTVYTVQVFKLEANSEADLAVMAQVAEINGTINGDLHFFGQVLKIHPDAVITGDLHIQVAQSVENEGTVEGNIIEDERPDLNLPLPEVEIRQKTDDKPAPGDVIETSDEAESPQEPTEEGTEPAEVDAAAGEDAAEAAEKTPQEAGSAEDSTSTENN